MMKITISLPIEIPEYDVLTILKDALAAHQRQLLKKIECAAFADNRNSTLNKDHFAYSILMRRALEE